MKRLVATLTLLVSLLVASPASADIQNADGFLHPAMDRFAGIVYDYQTLEPLSGVCVYAGGGGCPNPALRTNRSGYWALDFPRGLWWDFHFELSGYITAISPRTSKWPFTYLLKVDSGTVSGVPSASGAVPAGMVRFWGVVRDTESAPVPGVCVYMGPGGCPDPALVTDSRGSWAIDLPSDHLIWEFHFERYGFRTSDVRTYDPRAVETVVIRHYP